VVEVGTRSETHGVHTAEATVTITLRAWLWSGVYHTARLALHRGTTRQVLCSLCTFWVRLPDDLHDISCEVGLTCASLHHTVTEAVHCILALFHRCTVQATHQYMYHGFHEANSLAWPTLVHIVVYSCGRGVGPPVLVAKLEWRSKAHQAAAVWLLHAAAAAR
jgi:hypothetical protein